MPAAIVNAATKTVDQAVSPMTIMGWLRDLALTRVTKAVSDYETTETETPLPGQGTWQPLSLEQLAIKKEGERSWRWFEIHCTTDLVLQTDDVIKRDSVPYRVMADLGWDDNGFRQYHVVNDYR